METSAFKDWFIRKYNDWVQAQPGEEDFLAFCDLLGYTPAKVNEWLDGVSVPDGPEVLSIAGVLGLELFDILGQPKPDQELIEIFYSFPQLKGDFRGNLALAIWEIEGELKNRKLTVNTKEARVIIDKVFSKWGFDIN